MCGEGGRDGVARPDARKASSPQKKRQGGILPWSTWREGSPVSPWGSDSVTVRECVAVALSLPVGGDLLGQP